MLYIVIYKSLILGFLLSSYHFFKMASKIVYSRQLHPCNREQQCMFLNVRNICEWLMMFSKVRAVTEAPVLK